MLHLYRHRHFDPGTGAVAPEDITQDGIGEGLGVSRSYASLILSRMMRDGIIDVHRCPVVGEKGRAPRKIYCLTTEGIRLCDELLDGRSIDELLPRNLNHCSTADFDSLPRDERDALGCIMVLGRDMHRSEAPGGGETPLLPVDTSGRVAVKENVRRLYISRADPESLRRWHSLAADWCADHHDLEERVVHLTAAGRNLEAERLALANRYALMDRPKVSVASALDALACVAGSAWLSAMAAFSYLRLGCTDRARKAVGRMGEEEPCLKGAIMSEIMLAERRPGEALDQALDAYCGDVPTATALGKSMAANGRHMEALVYLGRSRRSMAETGCLFRLDEVLGCEAESLLALGQRDRAVRLLMAASCAAKDDGTGSRLLQRARKLASEDGAGPQGVHVGDVQLPDILDAPLQHREPLEPEAPCQYGILDTEGRHDLGPEDPCAAELHPLPVEEHLQLK